LVNSIYDLTEEEEEEEEEEVIIHSQRAAEVSTRPARIDQFQLWPTFRTKQQQSSTSENISVIHYYVYDPAKEFTMKIFTFQAM
jgi:hypothetical protein